MVANLAEAQDHGVPPEIFLRNYRALHEARAAQRYAAQAMTRAKQAAKRDGVDLDAMKLLDRLALIDVEEAALQLRHVRQYAAWAQLPIGTQIDLFPVAPVQASAISEQPTSLTGQASNADGQKLWEAGMDGTEAGTKGWSRNNNPYPHGSELYQTWDMAWLTGQKQIAESMSDEPPAKRGRGRPRKPRNGEAAHLTA